MSSKTNSKKSKSIKKSKKGINSINNRNSGNTNRRDNGNCDLCNRVEKLVNFKPKDLLLHYKYVIIVTQMIYLNSLILELKNI